MSLWLRKATEASIRTSDKQVAEYFTGVSMCSVVCYVVNLLWKVDVEEAVVAYFKLVFGNVAGSIDVCWATRYHLLWLYREKYYTGNTVLSAFRLLFIVILTFIIIFRINVLNIPGTLTQSEPAILTVVFVCFGIIYALKPV
jgi:hypothetical protein